MEHKFKYPTHRPNKPKHQIWSRERIMQGHVRTQVSHAQKTEFLEGFQQSTFTGKVREGCGQLLQTSWCRNPLFLQLSTQVRSRCSCKPPTSQMFSIVQLFNLYMNVLLKVRALRIGCPLYFWLQATLFYKRCRASMTKHRQ